jgi:quercetin dioxygenase-like cupin family protein
MYRRLLPVLVLSFLALAIAQEVKTPQAWNAKTIHWQTTAEDGTKWAVLQGKQDAPGEAFTYAAFIPAGFHDRHSHSSDARVAVVQGALKVSFADNPSQVETYPVGSFLFVPANIEHSMAADEDTILIGTATGPWSTHHHGDHQHH